jgi:hypothetical protein
MQRKEFESNPALELLILSQINLTHPTGTDLIDNPIVRHHCAFGQDNE